MNRLNLIASCLGVSMLPAVGVAQEGCRALTEVTKLPALTALLDSAALVSSLPAPNAGAPGEVLVSVMTGRRRRRT
jgi:hypothetical protein